MSFKKGHKPSLETREKMSETHKRMFKEGENLPPLQLGRIPWNFKGDQVGYHALHGWVSRKLGKAFWCTFCFSMVNVQWANVSKEYKRNLDDWIQLCVKCHHIYDDIPQKVWISRRKNSALSWERKNG